MSYTIIGVKALKDNYIWHIIHSDTNRTILVDPGEAEPVLTFLATNKLKPAAILVTHHHYDHTDGIAGILANHSVPVFGPEGENIPHCTVKIKDNNPIYVSDFPMFTTLAIPGHTKHHVAYYARPWLFCGDTLFTGGCGRVFEGTYEQMHSSLLRLKNLPDDTQVFCGHEYTVANLQFAKMVEPNNEALIKRIEEAAEQRKKDLPTVPALLSLEKQTNPFLRCGEESVQQAVKHRYQQDSTDEITIFKHLREWKNQL